MNGVGTKASYVFHGRIKSIAWVMVVTSMLVASPAYSQPASPDAKFQFDIPSQPLASALKSYSAISQREVFYESSLVDRRQSPSIHGLFSSDAALYHLLEGTGFTTTSLAPGTVTILAPPSGADGTELATIKARSAEFRPYFALVQSSIRFAICNSPAIQVDSSELIVRLWIAPSGAVARAQLVSSGRTEEQEQAYAAAIRALVIGEPPPPDMPQPITMMMLPRSSSSAAECASSNAARRVEP